MTQPKKIGPRTLAQGQSCEVWTHDIGTGQNTRLLKTSELLLEAPNWSPEGDALILNGDGLLWRLPLAAPQLAPIAITGIPPLNNDHVLDPDGVHIFMSAYDDFHIYRAPLKGGEARRVTGREGPEGLLHFLHGVSPDGAQLAFVGLRFAQNSEPAQITFSEICTVAADGSQFRQITHGGVPVDGPEYSPDGACLYYNSEAFTGHAQIARMRPDGSDVTRLSFADTVDWFPHLSPDGSAAVYLAYPPGTRGHPADHWVELMLVRKDGWANAVSVAKLFGGQGTVNVNSWSPDSRQFAYVAYPMD